MSGSELPLTENIDHGNGMAHFSETTNLKDVEIGEA